MQIIHVFWSPNLNGIDNDGHFYLWVETQHPLKQKEQHPYQISAKELGALSEEMAWTERPSTRTVNFPVDENNHVLLSPIIANLTDFDGAQYHQHATISLHLLQITSPFAFLKTLHYQQFGFDEEMVLADDAKFWIQLIRCVSEVIKRDDFIPVIYPVNEKKKIHYKNKWEIISADFESEITTLANAMPVSCCLGDFSCYDKLSALQHASDVLLNQLVDATCFSQKNEKDVENTLLKGSLPSYKKIDNAFSKEQISQWAIWRNQLQHEQFGADFQLCFRLIEAKNALSDDWGINVQLQSKKDPSFYLNVDEYWQQKECNAAIYQGYFGDAIDRQLLLQLGYACRVFPILERVFATHELTAFLPMSEAQALLFLREQAWQLKSYGYRIIIPSWWTQKARNKLKIKLNAKAPSGKSGNPVSYFGSGGLIDFDYQVAMGEQHIDDHEWRQLIDAKSDLVYFRGEWIEINKEEMEKIQKFVSNSNKNNNKGNIQTLLQLVADDDNYITEFDNPIQDIINNLKGQESLSLIEQPDALKATLRPYQLRGVSWLCYLEKLGMHPCLADDMGLGKTMQIIALLLIKPKTTPALLIAPTSVIGNWFKELEKFAPSLQALIHHGTSRAKPAEFIASIAQYDIVITSYGLIRRDKALFDSHQWSRVIIDEAQNIKNPTAAQTKIIFNLKTDHRIALTGTPIENRLMDLWSIFNFLNPGFLDNKTVFRKQFELPVQRENDQKKKVILKNLVSPFILRRLKTDKSIISDLPEKIEQKVYCELSVEQASLYQLIVEQIKQQLNQSEEEKDKKIIMLSALLRLKQCCNHPAQYLQDGSEFSEARSIKLQRLVETTKEAIQNNESILIFSQFTDICEKLHHLVKNKLGFTTHYLHGGTPRKQRESMIDAFQSPESPASVFILSLKAGGVGITLTKANHVIHFDRWWNPAVENQATDRAYRIGQKKTVFAHKFITLGTIEEKIDAMLEEKQALADGIIGSDESWLTQLSTAAFIKMIELNQTGAAQ